MRSLICLLLSWLFTFGIQSCKKIVEVGSPSTQVVTTNVFNDNNAATGALLSIYAQMYQDPWNIDRVTGISSDEFTNYATDATSIDLYSNALNAISDADAISIWAPAYNYIYQANAILEGLQGNEISPKIKQQISGEALFIRAFWYFYLVNLYGNVPLVTGTDYKANSILPRADKSRVYQQIIYDLKLAQSSLSIKYVDATDTIATSDRVRPTTWAATALLARVYLYVGSYDSAETQSTKVINNSSLFTLPSDLNEVFLANSSEAIWQLLPQSSTTYTPEGSNFILTSSPGSYLNNSTSISDILLNSFETGDQRKDNWINSYTDGTDTWYYPYKYKDDNTSSSLNEYSMVLRLAEQFLIRAEARTQQNKMTGAISDINVIRQRAGLVDLPNTLGQAAVLSAILHERQVELFTEGQRWMDLKRTGMIDAVMTTITGNKGGNWNTNQQLYPIPVADIKNDNNIIQNKGY